MMRNSKKYLPLIIGMLILFPVFILPLIQTTINSYEHDHDDHDHDDHLQCSYIPCECGNPGCTGNVDTCPWELGRPYPAPTLYQPASPDDDGIITLTWTSSYGANSYKVYRSDAEFGTYTLIATTSSLSYTDTTTDGTWWYYVRAYNSNGYSPSNKIAVEVYFCTPTWYESNEEYNIGDCPVNEWYPDSPSDDDIDVVWASTYDVDMYGKAIRMYTPNNYDIKTIKRDEEYRIDPGKSLYLKFSAQMNKKTAKSGTGEGRIFLIGNKGETFLKIIFDSYTYGGASHPKIRLVFPGEEPFRDKFIDLILNRVYDFDVIFMKDSTTNKMKYFIFIDQKLELIYEANTNLYPIGSYVELVMKDPGPGEFFLDNFYLGNVTNNIFTEDVITAVPMYYLYAPEFEEDEDIKSIDMKYLYNITEQHTIKTSLYIGFTFLYVFPILLPEVKLSEVISFYSSDGCEVSTTGTDLVIFNLIEANKSDLTFTLPGVDPNTGASNITILYNFDILNQSILAYNIDDFNNTYGMPENFSICKNQVSYNKTLSFQPEDEQWESIESRNTSKSYLYCYETGSFFSIPIPYTKGLVKFHLGYEIRFEYSAEIETEAQVGIKWKIGAESNRIVDVKIFTPAELYYSTPLDLPPYSAKQVT